MSNSSVQNEIVSYVRETPLGVLAYVRADGTPVQRTFGAFALDGGDIVFATKKRSAKVAELAVQPRVSFFVEKRAQSPTDWKSALFVGSATPITAQHELQQASASIAERNAFVRNLWENDGLRDFEVYRLKTQVVEWLDYSKGRGYVESVAAPL